MAENQNSIGPSVQLALLAVTVFTVAQLATTIDEHDTESLQAVSEFFDFLEIVRDRLDLPTTIPAE